MRIENANIFIKLICFLMPLPLFSGMCIVFNPLVAICITLMVLCLVVFFIRSIINKIDVVTLILLAACLFSVWLSFEGVFLSDVPTLLICIYAIFALRPLYAKGWFA